MRNWVFLNMKYLLVNLFLIILKIHRSAKFNQVLDEFILDHFDCSISYYLIMHIWFLRRLTSWYIFDTIVINSGIDVGNSSFSRCYF
jgi:hypothetical protein